MRLTCFELYETIDGEWRLLARFPPQDQALAKARAESHWEATHTATILIEEGETDSGECQVTVTYRSPGGDFAASAPDLDGGIGGRLALAALVCLLIAVLAGGLAAAGSGGNLGLAALAFIAAFAIGLMVMVRLTIPVEVMLWRNKSHDSKMNIIALLERESAHDGNAEAALAEEQGASYAALGERERRAGTAARQKPRHAGETSLSVAASAAALLNELIGKQSAVLNAFAGEVMAKIAAGGIALQSFDRFGVNLYLAGAAQELARREALTDTTLHTILTAVLVEYGTGAEAAKAFCERLEGAATRPRYRAMLEAGRGAMQAMLDGRPIPEPAAIAVALKAWSNPGDRTLAAQKHAVMVTDIVGSTEMTRKLGNTAAQRMLRAHNSIVRAAVKQFRGNEIKHTGDGIMAVFARPIDAVEAAVAVQQDVFAYGRDNPEAAFKVRVGVDLGEGSQEDGEYYGPVFDAVEDVCAVGGGGDIVVTPALQESAKGGTLRYAPLPANQTDGMPGLARLAWEPKRVISAAPLEYRQIGGVSGKPGTANKGKDGDEPDF